MQRHNPIDWRTNIGRGGQAVACQVEAAEIELARRAAEVIGAPFVGVDLLPARDGRSYLLEVNAVPGWKALARATDQDVAALLLDWLEQDESSSSSDSSS
jgi:ribosomal protein S6--L-glutamate ligase